MDAGNGGMIKPMLAVEANLDKLRFPCIGSPKLDGIRCVIENEVLSRSLKPIRNKYVQGKFSGLTGFDGELIVGEPTDPQVFTKTSSGVMSFDGEPDVKLFVFDDWKNGGTYYERFMNRKFQEFEDVVFVESTVLECIDDVLKYMDECVVKGFEGIMLRDPLKDYKFGRATVNSQELLKMKNFSHDEYLIVGMTELMHNHNEPIVNALGRTERSTSKSGLTPSGILGALILQYDDELTFECGTGFSLDVRREMFQNKHKYLGELARIKHQESGAKDLPRFPVFDGIRNRDDLGG